MSVDELLAATGDAQVVEIVAILTRRGEPPTRFHPATGGVHPPKSA